MVLRLPAPRVRVILLLSPLLDPEAFLNPMALLGAYPNRTAPRLLAPFRPSMARLPQGILTRILRDLGLFLNLTACPASVPCQTLTELQSRGLSLRSTEHQPAGQI